LDDKDYIWSGLAKEAELQVIMLDAKTNLSRLVDAVESGQESEILIARNGRPAARLVPCRTREAGRRIGVARGKFLMPDSIDADETAMVELFAGRN
jgi:prevent-host-death family protein